ncbi:MAG: hypothetical protein CSB33_01920 [Desulfobacterales bacterium]|nr:MAG: hypothetical protein CSB33_01920 [Desulfobacterales bacterium]
MLLALAGGVGWLYHTDEGVANELRQIRQPRPNRFLIGIDVSATINKDLLEKLKTAVTERLEQFIGDASVYYEVYTFGNPGCANQSFRKILAMNSPMDQGAFDQAVAAPIQKISITRVAPRDATPLTTPLFHFLGSHLPEKTGERIVIFSDLMNDDSDCPRQFVFPDDELRAYGEKKEGQLVFLYPLPHLTDNRELNQRQENQQKAFMGRMKKMARAGDLRVFFFRAPDERDERLGFLRSQLKTAIPATTFDIVWERATRVINTLVSAVRG